MNLLYLYTLLFCLFFLGKNNKQMADTALWLKCSVVIVILGYYSIQLMRYLDDWYRKEFQRYLQVETKRNPYLLKP